MPWFHCSHRFCINDAIAHFVRNQVVVHSYVEVRMYLLDEFCTTKARFPLLLISTQKNNMPFSMLNAQLSPPVRPQHRSHSKQWLPQIHRLQTSCRGAQSTWLDQRPKVLLEEQRQNGSPSAKRRRRCCRRPRNSVWSRSLQTTRVRAASQFHPSALRNIRKATTYPQRVISRFGLWWMLVPLGNWT